MKRNSNIIPLSRDHHTALLFCWKIRQGLKNAVQAERMIAYVAYFFEQHLHPHFREEEEILFVVKEDPLVIRAEKDHDSIKKIIADIVASKELQDNFSLLAKTLDDHIRFEERQLFPHLEQILDTTLLEQIGTTLALGHKVPATDNFEDEFWIAQPDK